MQNCAVLQHLTVLPCLTQNAPMRARSSTQVFACTKQTTQWTGTARMRVVIHPHRAAHRLQSGDLAALACQAAAQAVEIWQRRGTCLNSCDQMIALNAKLICSSAGGVSCKSYKITLNLGGIPRNTRTYQTAAAEIAASDQSTPFLPTTTYLREGR